MFFENLFSGWWNLLTLGICLVIPAVVLWRLGRYERLVNYIPAFCTSVGIFMTFAILYDTLGTKVSDMDLSGQDIIKNIIGELSNKFSCSLIGIFFSIFWSGWIRTKDGFSEKKLSADTEWKKKDPQELLWELGKFQLHTIEVSERAIDMNNENARNISNAIENSRSHLSRRLEYLTEGQEHMNARIENISGILQNSIQNVLADFQKLLQQLIEKLGSQTLDIFGKNIEEVHKSLKDLTDELLKKHQTSLDSGIKEVTESIVALKPLLEKLTVNFENQTQEIKDSSKRNNEIIQEEFKASTEGLLLKFNTIAEGLNTTFTKINETFEQLGQDVQDSSQAILNDNLEKIQLVFDSLEEKQLRTKSFLEETTQRFSQAVEAFEDAQNSNEGVLQKVEEQMNSLAELQEVAQDQLSVWEDQLEEIKRLREEVNDIANTVGQLQLLRAELAKLNGRTH